MVGRRPARGPRRARRAARTHPAARFAAPRGAEDLRGGWRAVAADPEPFLSLGLVAPGWLEANLDALREGAEGAPVEGDRVVHMDIRSDNLCLVGGRCRIVDWNWVCRGNPDLDVAFWMPSLRLEGGPEPTGHPELAAMFAGYLACRAGLPEPAAGVRVIQRAQLEITLPWAARELGLSPPRPR